MKRVRIKHGWDGAGRTGDVLALVTDRKGQQWVIVQWDFDDDPDLFKAAGLTDDSLPRKEKSAASHRERCEGCRVQFELDGPPDRLGPT